ncbi:ankyrin repeat-containing protein [Cavenderia fasciculata]|uniref:Ankyrin repeat-containing protein n=1 Tax=Cavenderia fasciculata TaxID=261658 RepID=F4PSF6_CACFS|nr:ankyrin repeat-containing protein [Cavenderia fasciculata]EGG21486.1 ankyrin repeat-containing protein [Cavenderia fasciculata]|eukprot:XP_004359336.1 ankyrin repeat-containing protein [Cavenderia fasciculata]
MIASEEPPITSDDDQVDQTISTTTTATTTTQKSSPSLSSDKDIENGSLLKYAAESDDFEAVKRMIEKEKISPNQKDKFGDLPLHGAIVKGRARADPNIGNGVGSTSLHKLVTVASIRDQFDMIDCLIKAGADPTIKNVSGLIPEQLAIFSKIKEVLQGDQLVTVKVHVERVDHGKVIGKGGKKLNELRELTNTQINIPGIKDTDHRIEIKGRKDDVEIARQRILEMIKPKEPKKKMVEAEPEGDEITLLKVPNIAKENHRLIIGSGGSTIKRLREEFKVKITIPPPDSANTAVEIQGDIDNVTKAMQEINKIIKNTKEKKDKDNNHNNNNTKDKDSNGHHHHRESKDNNNNNNRDKNRSNNNNNNGAIKSNGSRTNGNGNGGFKKEEKKKNESNNQEQQEQQQKQQEQTPVVVSSEAVEVNSN